MGHYDNECSTCGEPMRYCDCIEERLMNKLKRHKVLVPKYNPDGTNGTEYEEHYKADEADAHYGELIETHSARHEVLLDAAYEKIDKLQASVNRLTEKLREYQKRESKGIYYTIDEINQYRRKWVADGIEKMFDDLDIEPIKAMSAYIAKLRSEK